LTRQPSARSRAIRLSNVSELMVDATG
jgi:hypothetical protein